MSFYPYYEIDSALDLIKQLTAVNDSHASMLVDMDKSRAKGELEYWLSWNAHKLMMSATYDKIARDLMASFPEEELAIKWRGLTETMSRFEMAKEDIKEPESVRGWLLTVYSECFRHRPPHDLTSRSTNASSNFMEDCKADCYSSLARSFDIRVAADYMKIAADNRDAKINEWKAEADKKRADAAEADRLREEMKTTARRERRAARKAAQV